MNATMEKFGYPGSVIHEYQSWVVLLRTDQATLGSLVLACKENATRFSQVSHEAMSELGRPIRDIETALETFSYEKINYLMLMMVDKHVHFHVIPRYSSKRDFSTYEFNDPGWPGQPDLSFKNDIGEDAYKRIIEKLKAHWCE